MWLRDKGNVGGISSETSKRRTWWRAQNFQKLKREHSVEILPADNWIAWSWRPGIMFEEKQLGATEERGKGNHLDNDEPGMFCFLIFRSGWAGFLQPSSSGLILFYNWGMDKRVAHAHTLGIFGFQIITIDFLYATSFHRPVDRSKIANDIYTTWYTWNWHSSTLTCSIISVRP